MLKRVTELRKAFWDAHPQFKRQGKKTQNDYSTDICVYWNDFKEYLRRDGQISEALAQRATL